MTVDLTAILSDGGEGDAERPRREDVVTTLWCPCGAVVALVARFGGESWLWRAGYRHTPRGAADIVVQAALDDFEALAAIAREDPALEDAALSAEVRAIGEFARLASRDYLAAVVPALRMPARIGRVTGIAQDVADLNAQRDPGLAPVKLAHTTAGCPTCRSVLDVQEAVVQVESMPQPPRTIVVEDLPALGVERMGYGWPESGRAARVALYRALSDVLGSKG